MIGEQEWASPGGDARFVWGLFRGCGVDGGADLGDLIGREAALFGVLEDGSFVGGDVDAVDFVVGNVAVKPLDLGAEVAENAAGSLGDGLELIGSELASARDFAFDHEFWHGKPPMGNARERIPQIVGLCRV